MTDTPFLSLPLLAAAQSQKHVTHNEALMRLDALAQLAVAGRRAGPPAAPLDGDRLLVAAPAVEAFAGRENAVALRQDGAWIFLAPRQGWRAYVADEDRVLVWTGAAWRAVDGPPAVNPVSLVGVNATADTTHRLSVRSPGVLLSHGDDGGDVRLVLNKRGTADVASVLFQSAWSGRAEFGLDSADRFTLRSSVDGASFASRLTVDPATGRMGVGRDAPQSRLDVSSVNGDGLRLSSGTVSAQLFAFGGGTSSADAFCDLDLSPGAATAAAAARLFRNTSTTGTVGLYVLRGNGTGAANAVVAGSGHSYVCAQTGNFGVGVAAPVDKLTVAGAISPSLDNAYALGAASRRFSAVWAVNGVIQTSDAREKTDIETIGDWALDFVAAVPARLYRWRAGEHALSPTPEHSGQEPANLAEIEAARAAPEPHEARPLYALSRPGRRRHAGFLAQEVRDAMDRAGRDWGAWGLDDRDDPASRQFLRMDELLPVLWAAVAELARRAGEPAAGPAGSASPRR